MSTINDYIPVKITNATLKTDRKDVSTEQLSAHRKFVAAFEARLSFITEPCSKYCTFNATIVRQDKTIIRINSFDVPEIQTKRAFQEVRITMLPDPRMWPECGCKSMSDCPKRIASGTCPCSFMQENLYQTLLKQDKRIR